MQKLFGISLAVALASFFSAAYADDIITPDQAKSVSATQMRDPKVSTAARRNIVLQLAEASAAQYNAGLAHRWDDPSRPAWEHSIGMMGLSTEPGTSVQPATPFEGPAIDGTVHPHW